MALTKITSSVVAVNSLTVANIADNAVDATKIASNSILTRHIDDNQIGIDQLNVSDGSSGQALTTNGSGTLSFASVGVSGISSSADATAITIGSDESVTFAAGITSTASANSLGATSFNEADLTNVGTIYADQFLGDADADTGVVLNGSNVMTLHTNNTERMRFDSTGAIQIGGTTNAGFIDFDGTKLQLNAQRHPNTGAFVNTSRSHASIELNGSDGGSLIVFRTTDSNNSAAGEKLRIQSAGGISFNGDTATANALDDYEEGTWTPACGATLTTAVGIYTKVGRLVTVQYHIVSSGGLPTSSSQVIITGLPFTSNSTSLVAAPVYARYYTPNDSSLTSLVYDNESQIRLMNINDQNFDLTVWGELEASHNNSIYIIGQATYATS